MAQINFCPRGLVNYLKMNRHIISGMMKGKTNSLSSSYESLNRVRQLLNIDDNRWNNILTPTSKAMPFNTLFFSQSATSFQGGSVNEVSKGDSTRSCFF